MLVGHLAHDEDVDPGIEGAPGTLVATAAGNNSGK